MMNWISTRIDLPRHDDLVLMNNNGCKDVGRYSKDTWYSMMWNCVVNDCDVTHSMPLPELPK